MKCFTGPLNLPAVWTSIIHHKCSVRSSSQFVAMPVRHLQTTGNLEPSSNVQLHVLTVIPVLCFWCVPTQKKKKQKRMSHLSGFYYRVRHFFGKPSSFHPTLFWGRSYERPVPVTPILSSVTSPLHINPGSSIYRDQSSPSCEKPQNASQILRDVNTTHSRLPISVKTRPICLSTLAVVVLIFRAPPSGPMRKWRL